MDRPDSRLSRAFSVSVLMAALIACAIAFSQSPTPNWVAVAIFTSLFVIADRTEVELPGGENVAPSFMILTAAVVVFVPDGAWLGPLLARLIANLLYLPEWRERKWTKLAFNTGMYVLYAGAAVLVAFNLPSSWLDSPLGLAILGAAAALAALLTNVVLLLIIDYLADRRSPAEVLSELIPFFPQVLPFAVLGAFLGSLYLDVGLIMAPLVIAPILIARQAFISYLELNDAQGAATETLIRALESKDEYTAGHVERVARYAEYIGRELQFTPGRLERLRLAALMHDIGKLVVPNELLNKPGKLTEEEFAIVKRHEQVSMELLGEIDFLAPVAPSASSEFTHYEPDDAKHPIEPYIVHVADAYDAMTSTRSYRKALSQGVAFAELRDKAGTQFHPDAVEALIRAVRSRGEEHGKGHEDEQHLWAVPPPESGTGSAGLGDLVGEEGSS